MVGGVWRKLSMAVSWQSRAQIFLILLGQLLVIEHKFEYGEVCNSGINHATNTTSSRRCTPRSTASTMPDRPDH
jgi:hypothetical protein